MTEVERVKVAEEREALELEVVIALEDRFGHLVVPSYVWETAVTRSIDAYCVALAASPIPVEAETLPEGVSAPSEPWVSIDKCAECLCESGDGYNVMVPLATWESEIEGWGWRVVSGRLLCFDCVAVEPEEAEDA